MTAHYLVNGCRTTRAGDVALVHAAAGGVGLLLIQLLVARGRARDRHLLVRREGGARARGRRARTWSATTARTSRPRCGGSPTGAAATWSTTRSASPPSRAACASLRPRGLLVLFGQSSGPVPPFELGRLNALGSLFVTRPSLAHYTADRAELELRSGAVLGAIAAGRARTCASARASRSRKPRRRIARSRGGAPPARCCCCHESSLAFVAALAPVSRAARGIRSAGCPSSW